MNKYDLSIVIPARNEMFLSRTVEDILQNKRGNTEIIVVLDGQWANPPINDHKDVTIIYLPEAKGQRGATNIGVKLSTAKYVAKVDAHCCFDEGFDLKVIETLDQHPDWTVTLAMYNFHVFNWVCKKCGNKWYQGQTPQKCMKNNSNGKYPDDVNPSCDSTSFEREIVWKRRESRRNEFYRFDKNLHFQYWNSFKDRPEGQLNPAPTMSIPGNFFALSRNRYWHLNICDEALAGKSGWGQQGVEVACKSWLSGGALMVIKDTWYAHMFRTQGGDFGFPFPISGAEQDKTRKISHELWMGKNLKERWPLAIYDLDWLLEKFKPIPDWHDNTEVNYANAGELENPQELKRAIIFYTDNQLNLKIAHAVQKALKDISEEKKIDIISASLKPMPNFGKNIHINLQRGLIAYFTQIVSALEATDADIVYFCEHDVIYHPSHFDYIPDDSSKFHYNQNFWKVRSDGFAVHWDANQVSGLICYRSKALEFFKTKLEDAKKDIFNRSYEPGGRDPKNYTTHKSKYPNIDIRHKGTMTGDKWSPSDFRDKSTCVNWQESDINNIDGWNETYLKNILAFQ